MEKLQTTTSWIATEISLVALLVLVIMISLGFTLWKSLSSNGWSLYWHISSFLTAVGAISLAISASRVVINFVVMASAFAIVFSGIASALFGATIVMIKYLRFRRNF